MPKICLFFLPLLLLLTGCDTDQMILTNLTERDANIIIVFLESKGIPAKKVALAASSAIGGESTGPKFNIMVSESQAISAIAILNQNGLPQKQGTNLLELFAKTGLMTTDKEETIRYQAGLAQQLTNTILMIDGVIDASVQLSFPTAEATAGPGGEVTTPQKITAAVYVKHQGVIDDPNTHLENKIKRLLSGSITGLDINDVTVVSDRSRFTDVNFVKPSEKIMPKGKDYVSIWSIVMNKQSAGRFRFLFFTLTFLCLIFAIIVGWVLWKFYPVLRKRGLKELLKPIPVVEKEKQQGNP